MKPAELDELCGSELRIALDKAQCMRTRNVLQDLFVLLDGFGQIRDLLKTGMYKGERVGAEYLPAGRHDGFYTCMAEFVRTSQQSCADMWKLGDEVHEGYYDMSLFFDDVSYVYPPPKDDQEKKRDLFGVLHDFAASTAKARGEIESLELATLVQNNLDAPLPFLARELNLEPAAAQLPSAPGTSSSPEATASLAELAIAALAPSDELSPVRNSPERSPMRSCLVSPQREGPILAPKSPTKKAAVIFAPEEADKENLQHDEGSDNLMDALRSLEPISSETCNTEVISLATPGVPVSPNAPPPQRSVTRRASQVSSVQSSFGGNSVMGTAPLNLSLAGPMSPPGVSPGAASITPGSAGSQPAWRLAEYRANRKSLTRQADRVVADTLGASITRVRGADVESLQSWRISESTDTDPSSPPRSVSPSSWDGQRSESSLDANGVDLSTQIRTECRRRKSRGAPSLTPATSPLQATLNIPTGDDSPRSPGIRSDRQYCLTPVSERGETPYRVHPGVHCR